MLILAKFLRHTYTVECPGSTLVFHSDLLRILYREARVISA